MSAIRLSLLLCVAFFCSVLPAVEIDVRQEMVPMRDGVRLSVQLHVPREGGPFPVLMAQYYMNTSSEGFQKAMKKLAEGGYVVAIANFRGSQKSEGTWVGYRDLGWGEKQDGYDVCEWLAKQPFSTGKVGTFGGSQAGFAQNFLAVTRPPHLVCQYMVDTGLSLYQEGYRLGGTTRPERFKDMGKVCRVPEHNLALMQEWFEHPAYDSYWEDEDCSLHFDQMNVPCFTVGSWYDFMNIGSIESFIGRQHLGDKGSRGVQQLIIGPWPHDTLNKRHTVGDVTYPENAAFDLNGHMLRWFDHHLKGIDNGVMQDPIVKYYVMGATGEENAPGNVWRTADDWPVPHTTTPYYLHADKRLDKTKPSAADAVVAFNADPLRPASIPGRSFPGAKDARSFEEHPDVRTFTTDILSEPVEWTGKVQAEIYLSSDAKDTDLIVRVSDVYPDGRSILIIDFPHRVRYREGFDREVLMEPGQVYKVAYDVGWMSMIFNKGHRIRVTVASTGAPLYEPNPNTGEKLTIDFPANAVTAHNSIHVNQKNASRIIAPVHRK
ncbi:MAG: CocE/NonD family hydrolase [Planctomycetaceae bacterium]|nr:CocE/NonD family hydrolase [Planctomycetaceae bacterium]